MRSCVRCCRSLTWRRSRITSTSLIRPLADMPRPSPARAAARLDALRRCAPPPRLQRAGGAPRTTRSRPARPKAGGTSRGNQRASPLASACSRASVPSKAPGACCPSPAVLPAAWGPAGQRLPGLHLAHLRAPCSSRRMPPSRLAMTCSRPSGPRGARLGHHVHPGQRGPGQAASSAASIRYTAHVAAAPARPPAPRCSGLRYCTSPLQRRSRVWKSGSCRPVRSRPALTFHGLRRPASAPARLAALSAGGLLSAASTWASRAVHHHRRRRRRRCAAPVPAPPGGASPPPACSRRSGRQLAQEGLLRFARPSSWWARPSAGSRPRHQAARQRHQLALAARQQRAGLRPRAGPSPAGAGHQAVQPGQARPPRPGARVGGGCGPAARCRAACR
jgi:hypothetical protein